MAMVFQLGDKWTAVVRWLVSVRSTVFEFVHASRDMTEVSNSRLASPMANSSAVFAEEGAMRLSRS